MALFEVGQKKSGGEGILQQCTITGEGSSLKRELRPSLRLSAVLTILLTVQSEHIPSFRRIQRDHFPLINLKKTVVSWLPRKR